MKCCFHDWQYVCGSEFIFHCPKCHAIVGLTIVSGSISANVLAVGAANLPPDDVLTLVELFMEWVARLVASPASLTHKVGKHRIKRGVRVG